MTRRKRTAPGLAPAGAVHKQKATTPQDTKCKATRQAAIATLTSKARTLLPHAQALALLQKMEVGSKEWWYSDQRFHLKPLAIRFSGKDFPYAEDMPLSIAQPAAELLVAAGLAVFEAVGGALFLLRTEVADRIGDEGLWWVWSEKGVVLEDHRLRMMECKGMSRREALAEFVRTEGLKLKSGEWVGIDGCEVFELVMEVAVKTQSNLDYWASCEDEDED